MENFLKISLVILILSSFVSCGDKSKPELQYMPDMYLSVPYNADGQNSEGKPTDLKPVLGTIARGQVPYEYADTNADYEKAKAELKSPLAINKVNLENGKKMYNIYCISCHGKKGDGNGVLSQRDKFVGIPNYKDRDITDGSIYHVIMYGKNLMGSHASQLTFKERWQVVQYVEELRNNLLK